MPWCMLNVGHQHIRAAVLISGAFNTIEIGLLPVYLRDWYTASSHTCWSACLWCNWSRSSASNHTPQKVWTVAASWWQRQLLTSSFHAHTSMSHEPRTVMAKRAESNFHQSWQCWVAAYFLQVYIRANPRSVLQTLVEVSDVKIPKKSLLSLFPGQCSLYGKYELMWPVRDGLAWRTTDCIFTHVAGN